MNKLFFFSFFFFSTILFFLYESFQENRHPNWLARVNDTIILKEDYWSEVKRLNLSEGEKDGEKKIKKPILDKVIEREILLQEAYRMGINKDKKFLFLVESFWKKLMIQRLLLEKVKDISNNLTIDTKKMQRYSQNFDYKIYARVLVCPKKDVVLKLMRKENLSH